MIYMVDVQAPYPIQGFNYFWVVVVVAALNILLLLFCFSLRSAPSSFRSFYRRIRDPLGEIALVSPYRDYPFPIVKHCVATTAKYTTVYCWNFYFSTYTSMALPFTELSQTTPAQLDSSSVRLNVCLIIPVRMSCPFIFCSFWLLVGCLSLSSSLLIFHTLPPLVLVILFQFNLICFQISPSQSKLLRRSKGGSTPVHRWRWSFDLQNFDRLCM